MLFFNSVHFSYIYKCLDSFQDVSGIGVLPDFLKDSVRLDLLEELKRYHMVQAPYERGLRKVRQEYKSFDAFPPESLFLQIRTALEEELSALYYRIFLPPNPGESLRFTHQVVQRYEQSPIGIGAHHDGESYINLVALLVLEGSDGLHSCDDGEGSNPVLVPNKAGDLILIPGFDSSAINRKVFHLVKDITEKRAVLAFRQKKTIQG